MHNGLAVSFHKEDQTSFLSRLGDRCISHKEKVIHISLAQSYHNSLHKWICFAYWLSVESIDDIVCKTKVILANRSRVSCLGQALNNHSSIDVLACNGNPASNQTAFVTLAKGRVTSSKPSPNVSVFIGNSRGWSHYDFFLFLAKWFSNFNEFNQKLAERWKFSLSYGLILNICDSIPMLKNLPER